jgi:hypothetical protein
MASSDHASPEKINGYLIDSATKECWSLACRGTVLGGTGAVPENIALCSPKGIGTWGTTTCLL